MTRNQRLHIAISEYRMTMEQLRLQDSQRRLHRLMNTLGLGWAVFVTLSLFGQGLRPYIFVWIGL